MNQPQQLKNQDKANKLVELYKSPRARSLEFLESVVDGTRYVGRPGWFDDTEAPVWDRAPCVKYLAVKSAIASNTDLLLGENRYPQVKVGGDEDEGEDEQEDGVGSEDSEVIERFLLSIKDEAMLEPLFRELYQSAQRVGSCCTILGVRNGELFAETFDSKWSTPTRDATGQIVSVEISYPYIETVRKNDGWHAVAKLFRRVVDANRDVEYLPGECQEEGGQPLWKENAARSVNHALGFIPIIWHKHDAGRMAQSGEDGKAIHHQITDELEQIDVGLSMRHEGALYCRPQLCEIGVEPGYNPTGSSSNVVARGTPSGGTITPGMRTSEYRTANVSAGTKRRRGPGWVNQYSAPDTKVQQLENSGDALKALDDDIRDLRVKVCETLAWVPLDPDSVKFAATVSGKALEVLRERQLNRISSDRETFGKGVIVPVYQMMLRLVAMRGELLRTPGIKKALPIVRKMVDLGGLWQPPRLKLDWPPYFLPTAEDTDKLVGLTIKALDKNLITKRTAVEKLQRPFNIENVDLYLEALKEEAEEREAKEAEQAKRDMTKLHAAGLMGLPDDDEGTGAGANSAKATPSGGGKSGGIPGPKKASPSFGKSQ